MTNRQLFLQHVAQTSDAPLALEILKAEGMYLWDVSGKKYLDLIAGISVCNIGHSDPAVVKAVQQQAEQYMHLMVYGEFVESPQVRYAGLLAEHLPEGLSSVYFTNSGAEAVEGAMKLVKRFTGRPGIIAFQKDYHGSTQGALSIIGDEYWRNAYRPLLPGITHLRYNQLEDLERITENTAGVIAETVQGEAGIIAADPEWLRRLRLRCTETGALLVLDEVQAGLGRTGMLWAFEQYGITPDVLIAGKALGGGMPLGAFMAAPSIMEVLASKPVLGHITTFGGHPVCCAAGMAAFERLLDGELIPQVKNKERLFLQGLRHERIRKVRSSGLMIAVEFDSFETNKKVIDRCIAGGVLTDWFLFAPECMRIAPPLIITDEQIQMACQVIMEAVASV
ncbi:MAG TPA: aminotransferase class III-fold pyridoxal phosphate-dependent enzyme [Chitinophagaceae bacterium]|nr:aminotransferase class III-fold pyridoxal phosphate-dependent enzyme [Chitinophagaceae bacterium]